MKKNKADTIDDLHAPKEYWRKLDQFKFDLNYYNLHYRRCITIGRVLKYLSVGFTTASTLTFVSFGNNGILKTICLIIIIVCQVLNAIVELLPYERRKNDLRDLYQDLQPVYQKMEITWPQIQNGELTDSEIFNIISVIDSERAQIEKNYLKEDSLPNNKRIYNIADKHTQEYFSTMGGSYNG